MRSLIFDTSALFNFGHRGDMEALLGEFGGCYRLWTTNEVGDELRGPPHKLYYEKLLADRFQIHRPREVRVPVVDLRRLSKILATGELSVILLGLDQMQVSRVVIDEKLARREAAALGLEVAGTIGLLKETLDRGWRTEDACLQTVRMLVRNRFRVRDPAPGESFAEYYASMK